MDSEMDVNEKRMEELCNDPFFVGMIFALSAMFPGESRDKAQSILNDFKEFYNEREQNRRENNEQNAKDSKPNAAE